MSSACYVYAIVGRDTPLPPARAAELRMVPWRRLAAITGQSIDGAPLTIDAVLRHEAVVEAVRRQGPALPVRFGTVFRDTTSVASALAERYERLAADLDRLGDKVELSLTALWAAAPPNDSSEPLQQTAPIGQSAGVRYLHARAAQLQRADALRETARAAARAIDDVLGALAIERRVSLLPTARIALRTAYLLEPANVRGFQKAFETIRAMRSDLRVVLTGPWPPYSFVGRSDGNDGATSDGRLAGIVQVLTDSMQRRLD